MPTNQRPDFWAAASVIAGLAGTGFLIVAPNAAWVGWLLIGAAVILAALYVRQRYEWKRTPRGRTVPDEKERGSFIHFEGGEAPDIRGVKFRTRGDWDGVSVDGTTDPKVSDVELTNEGRGVDIPAAVRLNRGRGARVDRPKAFGRADAVNATDHDDLLVTDPVVDARESPHAPSKSESRRFFTVPKLPWHKDED